MLRKVGIFLAVLVSALSCAAQTQTPRQALIEMFSGRDPKAFEKHLPKIMLQRIAAISSGSGAHMGLPASPQSLPMAIGRKGDMRWFETGPILLLAQDANGKCEVKVDKENLQGDRDEIELSFNAVGNGQAMNFGNGSRVMLTMQKEDDIWRLSEFGLTFKMKLDGSFLEAMAKQMGAMNKIVLASDAPPTPADAIPAKRMSVQDLSPTELAALSSLQKILESQKQYQSTNPAAGFTCNADALAVTEVNGYRTMLVGCKGTPVSAFKVTLTPVGMGIKGQRAFCADETGVLRFADDGRGLSCLSEHNQITSRPETAEGR
jgi:hypothetical protein